MATYATDSKQWSEAQLQELPVENGVRQRGLEVTRLDTFVDAAFAFVLTLLVISFDEIPSTYQEMIAAAKRIPGFAAAFAVLMMFWRQHRMWSRRYGLENRQTIFYSLTLIFVVLVYVYPLRMIFEGLFSQLSGGFLPTSYDINSYYELRMIFVFYSVGFLAMSLLISQLYRCTLRDADALALNSLEVRKTNIEMQVWLISAAFAVISITLALTMPDAWAVSAGYVYFLLIPALRYPAWRDRRIHGQSK